MRTLLIFLTIALSLTAVNRAAAATRPNERRQSKEWNSSAP